MLLFNFPKPLTIKWNPHYDRIPFPIPVRFKIPIHVITHFNQPTGWPKELRSHNKRESMRRRWGEVLWGILNLRNSLGRTNLIATHASTASDLRFTNIHHQKFGKGNFGIQLRGYSPICGIVDGSFRDTNISFISIIRLIWSGRSILFSNEIFWDGF